MEKRASDTIIDYFLCCYFACGLLFAFFYGTWAIGIGVGALCLAAYYITKACLPASNLYQFVLSAVLGVFMALYIYQMHGLFEMHFFAFIGSAILITYKDWRLQIPITVVVAAHHAAFGYLQNIGYGNVYFTQLDSFTLQTFIIHVLLAVVIFFTSGLWAYRLKKDGEVKSMQAKEVARLQQEALIAANEQKAQLQRHVAVLDAAVAEGKFEVASDFMHDIGNATVGFGSFLTQMRRLTEDDETKSIGSLAEFFGANRQAVATAIGENKADAVVQMLSGFSDGQKNHQQAIGELISRQAQAITRIHDILQIQRQHIDGQGTRERRSIHPVSLINDALALLFVELDRLSIVVRTDIPEGLSNIKGDRTRLMQVLRGVLQNSIDAIATAGSQRKLSIKLSAGKEATTIAIQDSGCGFDAGVGAHLFDQGFTTKKTSTGLSLYECRAIMESHTGTLDITSEAPGKGALATIQFGN